AGRLREGQDLFNEGVDGHGATSRRVLWVAAVYEYSCRAGLTRTWIGMDKTQPEGPVSSRRAGSTRREPLVLLWMVLKTGVGSLFRVRSGRATTNRCASTAPVIPFGAAATMASYNWAASGSTG